MSRRIEVKLETKFTLKEDVDEKSIASDTELMKILEEDNTITDESKITCKKEDFTNESKSHILLDALTKNTTLEGKYKTSIVSDAKTLTGKTDCDFKFFSFLLSLKRCLNFFVIA